MKALLSRRRKHKKRNSSLKEAQTNRTDLNEERSSENASESLNEVLPSQSNHEEGDYYKEVGRSSKQAVRYDSGPLTAGEDEDYFNDDDYMGQENYFGLNAGRPNLASIAKSVASSSHSTLTMTTKATMQRAPYRLSMVEHRLRERDLSQAEVQELTGRRISIQSERSHAKHTINRNGEIISLNSDGHTISDSTESLPRLKGYNVMSSNSNNTARTSTESSTTGRTHRTKQSRELKIYEKSMKYAERHNRKMRKDMKNSSIGLTFLYPYYRMASLISVDPFMSETELVTRAAFLLMSSMTCGAGLLWSFMYLLLEERQAAIFPMFYSVILGMFLVWCCLIPALNQGLEKTGYHSDDDFDDETKPIDRFKIVVNVQLFLILILPICVQISLGGIVESGAIILFSFICPLGGSMFSQANSLRWYTLYMICMFATLMFETTKILPYDNELDSCQISNEESNAIYLLPIHIGYFMMNFAGAFTIIYLAANSFSSKLEDEYHRSERLLQNMLPTSIAKRLKHGEHNFVDNYECCTILFADLVGFTQTASELHPNFLIGLFLKDVFGAFDETTEKFGLEKIKTIGDAYMVVGGLDVDSSASNRRRISRNERSARVREIRKGRAIDVINLAFAFQDVLKGVNEKYGLDFQLRIGIHTGPVIAGVIGNAKFAFGKLHILK